MQKVIFSEGKQKRLSYGELSPGKVYLIAEGMYRDVPVIKSPTYYENDENIFFLQTFNSACFSSNGGSFTYRELREGEKIIIIEE